MVRYQFIIVHLNPPNCPTPPARPEAVPVELDDQVRSGCPVCARRLWAWVFLPDAPAEAGTCLSVTVRLVWASAIEQRPSGRQRSYRLSPRFLCCATVTTLFFQTPVPRGTVRAFP